MKHTPKPSVIMGRALSEKRWDKSSETVLPPKPSGTSEMVVVTRPNGDVVLPLSVVGQGIPDDYNEVVRDIIRAMKRHTV